MTELDGKNMKKKIKMKENEGDTKRTNNEK